MTEEEWLSCTDPTPMLSFLQTSGKASDRKLRLFAVVCCRRIWHLLTPSSRAGVEVIERFAESEVAPEELAKVHREAQRYGEAAYKRSLKLNPPSLESNIAYRDSQQALLVSYAAATTDDFLGMVVIYSSQCACREIAGYVPTYDQEAFVNWQRLVDADKAIQSNLLREVIGNPVRPSPPLSSGVLTWNDKTVCRIAEVIYDDRRLGDLPILADALEEAGCANADILAHCRGTGQHVRGCWVVDLVLGKE